MSFIDMIKNWCFCVGKVRFFTGTQQPTLFGCIPGRVEGDFYDDDDGDEDKDDDKDHNKDDDNMYDDILLHNNQ